MGPDGVTQHRGTGWLGISGLVVIAVCAALIGGCESSSAKNEVVIGKIESEPKATATASTSMTNDELTLALDTFTDRSIRRISYAITEMLGEAETTDQRRILNRWRLRSAHSLVSILTDPNPKVALLDMIVVTYLFNVTAQEHAEGVLDMDTSQLQEATERNEADVWVLAARVLDEEQQAELKRLIDEWRTRHPEIEDYYNVRFNDFAYDTGGKTGSGVRFGISLFGSTGKSLDDATQMINEARMLGERALRQLKYLPMLTHWEMIVLLDEALAHEETQLAIQQAARLADSLDTLSQTLEQLPEHLTDNTVQAISEERKEAIDHFVSAIDTNQGPIRDLLNEFEETLRAGNELAGSVTLTAEAIEDLQPVDPTTDAPLGFDIDEYRELAHDFAETSDKANQMVQSMNMLLTSDAWDERTEQIATTTNAVHDESERIIGSLLRVGLILIALLIIGQFTARMLADYLIRRRSPNHTATDK